MDKYQTTFQTWNKVAAVYQDRFMDLDLYNSTYDRFCELLAKPEARVFEIGCGPGNITRYVLAKRPDLQLEAIDIAPDMIRLAQANNPTAHFRMMDCREIDTIADRFDGILCGFCLPYLSREDCAKLFKDCSNLLNSGGIFYVSAMEGDYEKSGFEASSSGDKMYVYYYREEDLRQLLLEHGFELLDLTRIAYPKAGGEVSTHLVFIARKA